MKFTHQGAPWVQGSRAWKGTEWAGSIKETQELHRDFEKALDWAKKDNRPLYLGEFGSFSSAEMTSRVRWTHAIAYEAEGQETSWCYWEFASGFGVYDPVAKAWRQPLRKALFPEKP
jgi:endoglucanase